MSYCIDKISDSGLYSLSLQHSVTTSFIILSFWSGNVLHRVCLGSSPRGMLLPRKIFALLASFISLFDTAPSCVSLIGFDEKSADCLRTYLPGAKRPFITSTYEPSDFESSLALPTAQIIERHDFRTILDFLLMKLRTALDRDWIQNLPTLHKVCSISFCVQYKYT